MGEYFIDAFKYMVVASIALLICMVCRNFILHEITLIRMIAMGIIVTIIFNGIFLISFGRTSEFQYLYDIFRNKIIDFPGRKGKK